MPGSRYDRHRYGRALPAFVVLYGMLYAAFGALSPFLPAFLQARQLGADEIGFVLGVGTAVRLVAGPVAGWLADLRQWHLLIFALCTTGAAVFALAQLGLQTFWQIFVAIVLWSACIAPAAPFADALALAAAKPPEGRESFEYGWVRGAGSAAFVLGTIASGQLIAPLGLGVTLALQSILLTVAAIWISRVPNYVRTPLVSPRGAQGATVVELLRVPAFRQIVLIAALVLGSHALHDSFAVIYWSAAGLSPGAIAGLWSEQVIAEVVVFFLVGPALLRKLGPSRALTLAAAAGAIRWGLMAMSTEPYLLALIEPLHGSTFALLHLAAMRVIASTTPLRLAATAQTVYGTLGAGTAVTIFTFVSGLLYEHLGGRSFWAMSALCVGAIPLAVRLQVFTRS